MRRTKTPDRVTPRNLASQTRFEPRAESPSRVRSTQKHGDDHVSARVFSRTQDTAPERERERERARERDGSFFRMSGFFKSLRGLARAPTPFGPLLLPATRNVSASQRRGSVVVVEKGQDPLSTRDRSRVARNCRASPSSGFFFFFKRAGGVRAENGRKRQFERFGRDSCVSEKKAKCSLLEKRLLVSWTRGSRVAAGLCTDASVACWDWEPLRESPVPGRRCAFAFSRPCVATNTSPAPTTSKK